MNNDYLANYGGPGIAYEDCWREFTVWPIDLVKALRRENIEINSVIDFGAADGRWLQELRELYGKPNLRVQGIELVLDYFPDAADFVTKGRIQDWQPKQFDLAFITALGYLQQQEIEVFMEKLSGCCTYLIPHMECWDSWRFRKDGLAEPEENTLWCLADWEIFFANYGWQLIYSDYFFIFKNSGTRPKQPTNFMFTYLNAQTLTYGDLRLEYDRQGILFVHGEPSIEQLHTIQTEFVTKRFCFAQKPNSGKWVLENGWWCSKFYDIY